MFHRTPLVLAVGLVSISLVSAIPWNATEYMFVFGDSYTTYGYNVSAGIDSTPTGYVRASISIISKLHIYLTQTSSNGPNWVEFLCEIIRRMYLV